MSVFTSKETGSSEGKTRFASIIFPFNSFQFLLLKGNYPNKSLNINIPRDHTSKLVSALYVLPEINSGGQYLKVPVLYYSKEY